MKASEIEAKVRTPHINVPVELENGKVIQLECPQITIGDWRDIKEDSGNTFSQWEILLDMSAGMDEHLLAGKSKKEQDALRNEAGMQLFRKVDQGIQVAMFLRSLRHDDPDITEEQVDRIISYGIVDKSAYVRALMFLLNGVKPEEIEAAQADDTPLAKKASKDTPTTDGQ